jgi:hypothetical protein
MVVIGNSKSFTNNLKAEHGWLGVRPDDSFRLAKLFMLGAQSAGSVVHS